MFVHAVPRNEFELLVLIARKSLIHSIVESDWRGIMPYTDALTCQ